MLKPVMKSLKDKDGVLGFAMSQKDATAILGARAKKYDVRINGEFNALNAQYQQDYIAAKAASDAARAALTDKARKTLNPDEIRALEAEIKTGEMLSNMRVRCAGRDRAWELNREWTNLATEQRGGEPRLPVPQIVNHIDGMYLSAHMYLLAREIPVGRNIKEAMNDPLGHHPRTRRKKMLFSGINAVKTTVTLDKVYKREAPARKFYHALIAADAVRLNQSEEDGTFRAVLTYWKLDTVALARDFPPKDIDLTSQFDLWGNRHPQEIVKSIGAGSMLNHTDMTQPDEGSGRAMGA